MCIHHYNYPYTFMVLTKKCKWNTVHRFSCDCDGTFWCTPPWVLQWAKSLSAPVTAWQSIGAEPGRVRGTCKSLWAPGIFGSLQCIRGRNHPNNFIRYVIGIWDQPNRKRFDVVMEVCGCFVVSGQPTICFVPWGTSVRS